MNYGDSRCLKSVVDELVPGLPSRLAMGAVVKLDHESDA